MPRLPGRRWLTFALMVAAFIAAVSQTGPWEVGLRFLFRQEVSVVYPAADLLVLVGQHVWLVLVSSLLVVLVGVPLGIWVTRPAGRPFMSLVSDLTSFGQTFPPIAVLALTVPLLGFDADPTILALFIYGLLPVVRNTIAGVSAVPRDVLEAAYGMGMSPMQALVRVEIPLSARVILAGIRTAVIINIGTAMIGPIVGAGGLGVPIIAGLVQFNVAFIIEGALPAAALAILADKLLANVEESFVYAARV